VRRVLKYKIGLGKKERLTSSNPTRLPPGAAIVSFEEADDSVGGFNVWVLVSDEAVDADDYESRGRTRIPRDSSRAEPQGLPPFRAKGMTMGIRIPPRTYTAGEVPPITPIERARVRNLFEKRYRANAGIRISENTREKISFVVVVIVILAILAGFAVLNGVETADASERIEIAQNESLGNRRRGSTWTTRGSAGSCSSGSASRRLSYSTRQGRTQRCSSHRSPPPGSGLF